jgi:hypothetical protein
MLAVALDSPFTFDAAAVRVYVPSGSNGPTWNDQLMLYVRPGARITHTDLVNVLSAGPVSDRDSFTSRNLAVLFVTDELDEIVSPMVARSGFTPLDRSEVVTVRSEF